MLEQNTTGLFKLCEEEGVITLLARARHQLISREASYVNILP